MLRRHGFLAEYNPPLRVPYSKLDLVSFPLLKVDTRRSSTKVAMGLQFPNAVVLNAVGRRNAQMLANERKRAQSARAQKSAKGCKRAPMSQKRQIPLREMGGGRRHKTVTTIQCMILPELGSQDPQKVQMPLKPRKNNKTAIGLSTGGCLSARSDRQPYCHANATSSPC